MAYPNPPDQREEPERRSSLVNRELLTKILLGIFAWGAIWGIGKVAALESDQRTGGERITRLEADSATIKQVLERLESKVDRIFYRTERSK